MTGPGNGRTAVVAVGGNALIVSPERTSIDDQYVAARTTARHLADLLASGWRVVVTHGSGPQVGFVLRRSELTMHELPPIAMHYASADIQGAVGYMFIMALQNELVARAVHGEVACVITRVLVDPSDPAFAHPSKPIGTHMPMEQAEAFAARFGWQVREDSGHGWRRVVASPSPIEIVDLEPIRVLSRAGYTVVACGGGGIPVRRDADGGLTGVEAVIDKDLASALLATELAADLFVVVTGVPQVAVNYGKPDERFLERMTVAEARRYAAAGHFGSGSMEPKVQAAVQFVVATGRTSLITDVEHLGRAVAGRGGTAIVPDTGGAGRLRTLT
jgi:carbamate kinase